MTYLELPSDAAFTLWLALLKPKQVAGEAHVRLTPTEKRLLVCSRRQNHDNAKRLPMVKKTRVPTAQSVTATRQFFTAKQIEIAMAVLAERENQQKRETA